MSRGLGTAGGVVLRHLSLVGLSSATWPNSSSGIFRPLVDKKKRHGKLCGPEPYWGEKLKARSSNVTGFSERQAQFQVGFRGIDF